ncbi:MAG TPA: PAS domain S-box protein, partial [Trichocoleus sp.]
VRWDEITPLDLKPLEQPALEELLREGKNTPYEKAFISKDGRRVPVAVGAALLEEDPNSIVSFVLDLTSLKRVEQRLAVQYRVTRHMAEAASFEEAAPNILQALCESLGWQLGILWRVSRPVDGSAPGVEYVQSWSAPTLSEEGLYPFNQWKRFDWNIGLPGRIWASGQPIWVTDLKTEQNFPRSAAAKLQLQSAFGFPILLEDEVLGVIECFSTAQQHPDADLLQLMAAVGSQIGQFQERKRAEKALQESQEVFQRFMNNSPASAFIKDEAGRFVYVNQRIEQVFEHSAADIIGKTDADFFPAEVIQQWRENDLAVLRSGRTFKLLETSPSADGERYYMSFKFPIENAAGDRMLAGMAIDITDRMRAEAALRDQEQRYRYIFEAVGVSIWEEDFSAVKAELDQLKEEGVQDFRHYFETHPEFVQQAVGKVRLINVNQATLRLFKAEDKQELLSSLEKVFLPETMTTFVDELIAIAEEQPIFSSETLMKTLQGEVLNVTFTITFPLPYQSFDNVLVSVTDVTDRRQAELALRESEERFQAFMRHSPAAAWIVAQDNRLLYLSPTYYQIFDFSYEDAIGKYIKEIYPAEFAEQFMENNRRVFETGQVYESVEVAPRTDGSLGEFLTYKFPINSGTEVLLGGVAVDITARRQTETALRESEERFRLAARAVAGIVYDWDLQTKSVYRSEGLLRLLGVEPEAAAPTQQWWLERIHPDDFQHFQPTWEALVNSTEDRYSLEYRVRHAQGHWVDILDQGYLIRDEQGQILRVLGSSTDISERKRAEAEREDLLARERVAREEAEAANRIKDEFLAVLSHELRSPLNPILGWVRLLRTRKFDQQATDRALETIERNARLQTQLIEDLLDVSRILRGKLALTIAPVDLVQAVEAALETVQLAAEAKNIQIQTHLDESLKPIVGDANRLQQVFWNLLSNAVKFTPMGGRVEVRLEVVDSRVEIAIADTGKGIQPEFLPHVFEYFRQADSTITRQFGGLGLGLAIVRHLTELHGGTVHAHSDGEGQGALFTVSLPYWVNEIASAAAADDSLTVLDLQGLRALVVDDEADTRELVTVVLQEYGAKVKSAASAAEALALLDQGQVDLLLSDIGMPGMDGYTLLRQVRSRAPEQGGQVPAIALTAYASTSDEQQALAAGFQQHIAKPVEPEKLVRAIHALLKHERQDT